MDINRRTLDLDVREILAPERYGDFRSSWSTEVLGLDEQCEFSREGVRYRVIVVPIDDEVQSIALPRARKSIWSIFSRKPKT